MYWIFAFAPLVVAALYFLPSSEKERLAKARQQMLARMIGKTIPPA